MSIPRGRLLAFLAILWVMFLTPIFLWTVMAKQSASDIHGPLEVGLSILLLVTAPIGWVGIYAGYALVNGLGWPASAHGQSLLVWALAGALGFLQWFIVAPALFGMALEHFTGRRTSLGLNDDERPLS